MHKTAPAIGARRRKTPNLRQKSGVIEYYGYRDYDAASGRWTARDPIGEKGGVNVYGMISNNTVIGYDLLGMILGMGQSQPAINRQTPYRLPPDNSSSDCRKCDALLKVALKNHAETFKELKASGCEDVEVGCRCNTGYDDSGGYASSAWQKTGFFKRNILGIDGKFKGVIVAICSKNTKKINDMHILLTHELIHIKQECGKKNYGKTSCEKSVCQEIQAYSQANFAHLDGQSKKDNIKKGVLHSSFKAHKVNPPCITLEQADKTFEMLYRKCSSLELNN